MQKITNHLKKQIIQGRIRRGGKKSKAKQTAKINLLESQVLTLLGTEYNINLFKMLKEIEKGI